MGRYRESPEYRELRCPCCGKPMQEMEVLDTYYGWDDEMYASYHYKYRCKECKITYDEKDKEWKLPKEYKATITEKQSNYLDILYNGFSNRLYGYNYRKRDIVFDKYIPDVISKEFATRLIQDKLDEQKEYKNDLIKKEQYESCFTNYGILPNHHFTCEEDNIIGYGLEIEDCGLIIFEVNKNTYELNLNKLEIEVNDSEKFLKCDMVHYINILKNLKDDLLSLRRKHDNF